MAPQNITILTTRFAILLMAMASVVHSEERESAGLGSVRRLTQQEKRGKQIYLRGTSVSDRKIMSVFGESSVEVPASALSCVNCHGYDGKGRSEGGITPSNITWEALTKPYQMKHAGGRVYPAYDDRALVSAVARGVDPAGNRLAVSMPRYRLTHDEAADLIAYMKCLGEIPDTGLTQTSVRVGILLPHEPQGAGEAVKGVLDGYFKDLNEEAGIFNRRIELCFANAGPTPTETCESVKDLIQKQQVFALSSAFIEGAEQEITALIQNEEVPLVGAVTNSPRVGFPPNRYVFYLLSGTHEMARAMVDFATTEFPPDRRRFAIVFPNAEPARAVVAAIEDQSRKTDGLEPVELEYELAGCEPQSVVAQLKRQDVHAVFLLGSAQEQGALLVEAHRQDWQLDVFVPGPLMGRELFDSAPERTGKTFVAFPRGPHDQTESAINAFQAFAKRHQLPTRHLAAQVQAYCSAMILVEGLKRAGKDVSREKLTTSMEGLYEFETGLTPQITFGPNRRIGSRGAYIVSIDAKTNRLVPASGWIELR